MTKVRECRVGDYYEIRSPDNYSMVSEGECSQIEDPDCYVGVEWEAEGCSSLWCYASSYWKGGEDGSLKFKGAELKFPQPLSGNHVVLAMEEFRSILRNMDEVYTAGERGSTHIHIDCTKLTFTQLLKFVACAWIFEPVLFGYECNMGRANNVFCVPMSRLRDYRQSLMAINSGYTTTENHKYRGVGLNSIRNFGTLEFRMFDTELEPNRIIKWINYLQRLRNVSLEVPFNSFATATEIDVDGFVSNIVGYPIRVSPEIKKQIWVNLRGIAHAWKQLGFEIADDPKVILDKMPKRKAKKKSGTSPSFTDLDELVSAVDSVDSEFIASYFNSTPPPPPPTDED